MVELPTLPIILRPWLITAARIILGASAGLQHLGLGRAAYRARQHVPCADGEVQLAQVERSPSKTLRSPTMRGLARYWVICLRWQWGGAIAWPMRLQNQSASGNSETRLNSPVLCVTRVAPAERAVAAIRVSKGPIGRPCFSRIALILAAQTAAS